MVDKEERLRAAVATRQEFAGQLVAAQQRELAIMAENAKLADEQVRFRTILPYTKSILVCIQHTYKTVTKSTTIITVLLVLLQFTNYTQEYLKCCRK